MTLLTTTGYGLKIVGLVFLVLSSRFASADVKVIANANVADMGLSADIISNIFLDKTSNLPSGIRVIPLDLPEGNPSRDELYAKVAKKDAAQLKSYWSRLVFTGKGQPPKVAQDDAEVLSLVSSNPNIIGYVSGGTNTSGVKVLLTLP